jgi:hypothetical protein
MTKSLSEAAAPMIRQGFFWFGLLCVLFAVGAVTVLRFSTPARGHSWYEQACCSEKDCAPVPAGDVADKPDGVHVKGWGVLSPSDSRLRWSRDDRDHVCQQPNKLLCVYRRPMGM